MSKWVEPIQDNSRISIKHRSNIERYSTNILFSGVPNFPVTKGYVTMIDSEEKVLNENKIPLSCIESYPFYRSGVFVPDEWSEKKIDYFLKSKHFKLLSKLQSWRTSRNFNALRDDFTRFINSYLGINHTIGLFTDRYPYSFDDHRIGFLNKLLFITDGRANVRWGQDNFAFPGLTYTKDKITAVTTVSHNDVAQLVMDTLYGDYEQFFSKLTVNILKDGYEPHLLDEVIRFCTDNTIKYEICDEFDFIKSEIVPSFTINEPDDVEKINSLWSKEVLPQLKSSFNILPTAKDTANTYILVDTLEKKQSPLIIDSPESEITELTEEDMILINELLVEEQ
jgi:hypothetical protein